MSCNCANDKIINGLYDMYGEKVRLRRDEELAFKIRYGFNNLIVKTISPFVWVGYLLRILWTVVIRKKTLVIGNNIKIG